MPKIKLPSKSPHIDMTPMVDLFSLLLTFFMLTTSFRPQEAAPVDTPSSVSEKQSPDKNVMTLLISKDNKVYFNVDNGPDSSNHFRKEILTEMAKRYSITFSAEEIKAFEKGNSFGMPIKDMKSYLSAKDPKDRDKLQTGIPMDTAANASTSELSDWIRFTRTRNPNVECAIKGDNDADYKVVKKIMDVLQANKVNKYNLTTNLVKDEATMADIK